MHSREWHTVLIVLVLLYSPTTWASHQSSADATGSEEVVSSVRQSPSLFVIGSDSLGYGDQVVTAPVDKASLKRLLGEPSRVLADALVWDSIGVVALLREDGIRLNNLTIWLGACSLEAVCPSKGFEGEIQVRDQRLSRRSTPESLVESRTFLRGRHGWVFARTGKLIVTVGPSEQDDGLEWVSILKDHRP